MNARVFRRAVAFSAIVIPGVLGAQEDPRKVLRTALRAVEGDSVAAVRARWTETVRSTGTTTRGRAALLGLATLARLTYQTGNAERLYRQLIDDGPADRFTPWALMGHGLLLEAQGDSRRRTLYERARGVARASGDRTAEGAALLEVAFAGLGFDGVGATLARLDSASRLLRRDDVEMHARRLRYEAVARVVSGDAAGERTARAAIALAGRASDVREEAAARRTLGMRFALTGQQDSALGEFSRAESLFRRSRDRRGVAYTLLMRADYLWSKGQLGRAKQAIQQALPEAEAAGYRDGVAHVHVGLASVAQRVGDFPRALSHAGKAIAVYDSLGDRHSLTLTHALRAQIHLLSGNPAAAQRESTWVLDVARNNPEMNQRVEAQQVLVAAALATGRVRDAERLVEESERYARAAKMGAWRSRLLISRARVARARGDLRRSRATIAEFLRVTDTTEHVPRYEARVLLSETYAAAGDVRRAAAELNEAAAELDRWRAGLTDQELRTLAFQSASPDAGAQSASVARVLHAIAIRGDAREAFELAERRRARELTDRVSRRAALAHETAAPAPPTSARQASSVTAAEVQRELPAGTALLEYVVGPQGAPTTLLVVTAAGVHARTIAPEDSLAATVARLAALLESGADPRALASALGTALLAPGLAHLPPTITRLVIVPDGVLHRVPFDALRHDGRFVLERYSVGIAPSAGVAVALWRRAPRRVGSSRLVAFGDPVFPGASTAAGSGDAGAADVYRSAFDATGGLPRLEGSAREVRLVTRYSAEADAYERESASAARLKRATFRDVSILHFATHALVDENSLTGSALALSPGTGESGFVTSADLAALRMDADLVVLSACRRAGGTLVTGEGIQGLTAPFLQAGARSVVATRWRISDRSTVPFIRDFYDALAAGMPVMDALRSAKLEAIARGESPREWAAFQVIGDPLVRVPLRTPSWRPDMRTAALMGATLLLLAAVAFGARRASRRAAERRSVPSPA